MSHGDSFTVYLVFLIGITAYLLPGIVAWLREHHQVMAIVALNILLGFTGLGWIIALVWSLTAIAQKETSHG